MSKNIIQLDMFREASEDEFQKSTRKSIKGLFARYNELEFRQLDMQKQLEQIIEKLFDSSLEKQAL